MMRAVAISLKIPDNEAYTALVALRRLGVAADRVERAQIYFFDDVSDAAALERRVVSDETIFNPNKHRAAVLSQARPRSGEVWIEPLDARGVTVAWRLFQDDGAPVSRGVLDMATERLLCNPAIDRAITATSDDRDISTSAEY